MANFSSVYIRNIQSIGTNTPRQKTCLQVPVRRMVLHDYISDSEESEFSLLQNPRTSAKNSNAKDGSVPVSTLSHRFRESSHKSSDQQRASRDTSEDKIAALVAGPSRPWEYEPYRGNTTVDNVLEELQGPNGQAWYTIEYEDGNKQKVSVRFRFQVPLPVPFTCHCGSFYFATLLRLCHILNLFFLPPTLMRYAFLLCQDDIGQGILVFKKSMLGNLPATSSFSSSGFSAKYQPRIIGTNKCCTTFTQAVLMR